MYVCMYVCMYVGMYVSMYLCMYVYMHVCMYVCTRYVICMYGYIYPSSVSESVRTRAYMNKSIIHPLVDEMQEEC